MLWAESEVYREREGSRERSESNTGGEECCPGRVGSGGVRRTCRWRHRPSQATGLDWSDWGQTSASPPAAALSGHHRPCLPDLSGNRKIVKGMGIIFSGSSFFRAQTMKNPQRSFDLLHTHIKTKKNTEKINVGFDLDRTTKRIEICCSKLSLLDYSSKGM